MGTLFGERRASVAPRPALVEGLESRRLLSVSVGSVAAAPTAPPAGIEQNHVVAIGRTLKIEATDEFRGGVGLLQGVTNVASDFRNLHASINWGDGSPETFATFNRTRAGAIEVIGSHTYAKPGNYAITAMVSEGPIVPKGKPNIYFPVRIATIHSVADVSAEEKSGGTTLTEVATQAFTARLGTVEFQLNPSQKLSAQVDWGDGTTSDATLRSLGGDDYAVMGTHTYAKTGVYQAQVVVTAAPKNPAIKGGVTPNYVLLVAKFTTAINVKGKA